MLSFYDDKYDPLANDPLKSFHNGHSGEEFQNLFYIRNFDPATYYTNIIIKPKFRLAYYDDSGLDGNTGWSVKLMYGKSKPSNEEWDEVEGGEEIHLPDIGTLESSDTGTFHPVWFRIYCPGNSKAQIKKNIYFEISFNEKQVVL